MSYQPIENYGIIGNMRTVAIVGMNGSIDWYCYPHFDSPSAFGAIMRNQPQKLLLLWMRTFRRIASTKDFARRPTAAAASSELVIDLGTAGNINNLAQGGPEIDQTFARPRPFRRSTRTKAPENPAR